MMFHKVLSKLFLKCSNEKCITINKISLEQKKNATTNFIYHNLKQSNIQIELLKVRSKFS